MTNSKRILSIDVETTGADDDAEILSIAVVDQFGQALLHTYVTPVRHSSWPMAQQIHHISPHFIEKGNFPKLATVAAPLIELLRDEVVIAYNMAFESRILAQNGIDLTVPCAALLCCMERYAEFVGEPGSKPYHGKFRTWKLSEAATWARYRFKDRLGPHNALGDALACLAVWEKLDAEDIRKSAKPVDQGEKNKKKSIKPIYLEVKQVVEDKEVGGDFPIKLQIKRIVQVRQDFTDEQISQVVYGLGQKSRIVSIRMSAQEVMDKIADYKRQQLKTKPLNG